METTTRHQYNAYQWPPDLTLAHLHARCSMPGRENEHGEECPCCLRKERIRTTKWYRRDLYKDFKYYGGGVSGYFGMLGYYGFATLILIVILQIYHVLCLREACTELAIKQYKCVILFHVVKIMSPDNIRIELAKTNPKMVEGLNVVYFVTFIFLLLVNFGSMTHLSRIEKKLTKQIRIFSHFSLIFRNIPRYMDLAQFKKTLLDAYPQAGIKEIFFLHKTSRYYETYHKLLQTYYQLQYYRMNEDINQLLKLQIRFVNQTKQLDIYKEKYTKNTGRAIVVFQEQKQKEFFAEKFHMSKFKQVAYNFGKLLQIESVNSMGQYCDSIAEPGEILWKYIGDSSVAKSKVRLETIIISIVFLGISTAIIFFPIKKANTELNHGKMMLWNIISGCIIFVLNLMYRFIMTVLSDQRKPNTYISRSFYIILTTVFFHILFYLYLPAIYYTINRENKTSSVKLGTLFFQVTIFVIVSIIIASIDFEYCIFRGKMRNFLADTPTSFKFCQKQLHEKLNYPAFPIQFKLMIMYKIWSFVVFYTFQIPEVLFIILPLMVFLYFGDKYRVYTRYKMSSYLPIQLEKDFDRTYIYVYLITLCLSYLTTATENWQFIVAPVLAVMMIGLRFFLDYREKKKQQNQQGFSKTETLDNVLKTFSKNPAIYDELLDKDSQRMSIISQMQHDDSITLKTVDGFTMGYKEVYDNFLHQFHHKKINQMLDNQYRALKLKYQPRAESEMTKMK